MARFLVFDTMAVNDSVNNLGAYSVASHLWNTTGYGPHGENKRPITPWIDHSATYASAITVPSSPAPMNVDIVGVDGSWNGASYPVRLFGGSAPVDRISWEFWLTGGASAVNVCWYQEFYNERATPFTWTANHLTPLPPRAPWAREQVEVVASSGLITHANIARSVTMNPGNSFQSDADSRVFPMVVHGQWVRLRVFSMTALGLNAGYYDDCVAYPPGHRLRIFAIVGGYEQVAAMDPCASQSLLWDSSVVNGPQQWDTSNPGTSLGYIGTWPTW